MIIYATTGVINSVTTKSDRIPFEFDAVKTMVYKRAYGLAKVNAAVVEIPDYTNTVNTTFKIVDSLNNGVIYASTGDTQNKTVLLDVGNVVCDGNYTLQVVLGGAAGDPATVYVTLYLDSDIS